MTNGNINLAISDGGVTGSMLVSFGASRQSVSISTQGIALKGVSIDLQFPAWIFGYSGD